MSNPAANEKVTMCKKSQSKISGTDKSQERLKERKIEEEEISDEMETCNFLDLKINRIPKDMKQSYLAAKKLVNLGELSKAMAQFKTIGTAPMTPLVKETIAKKFVKVDVPPTWPTQERVRQRRRSGRAGITENELKEVIPSPDDYIPTKTEWWKYYQNITAKDILNAIAPIRRTTAGGLNGITPWQYKKAIEYSPSNSLANTLSGLANRMGKNHFDKRLEPLGLTEE